MRRWALLIVGLVALLLGRTAPREPDELALVRVLGVDGGRGVTLTAVCGGDDQGDVSRGACAGENFTHALEDLPWTGGEGELSLTSVSYLVVGRDVALEEILLEVLRDEELGGLTTVWLADEGAAALLEACEDPASALSLLTRRGVAAPTAAQALAALSADGGVTLPLLGGEKKGPEWLGQEEWRAVS